ncbi:TetR/AcrR family transcriptional regulator [Gordonia sp. DT219]|uniref:TetR/AcrR family transcriptional regulator n=1 Tax=Gordonia sp. DT219 TaxID=3416658 RepID=UPI003CEB64ED
MTKQPERDRLMDLVIDLILDQGLIDLSLSAIAREIGSNNRMLLYYFGSREALLDEASLAAFDRFPRLHNLFDGIEGPGPLRDRLIDAWDDLGHPDNHEFLRLYFQRFGIAMREPGRWKIFIERVGQEWLLRLAEVLRREGYQPADATITATGIVALWRGLQMLVLSGVDADQLRVTYRESLDALLSRALDGASNALGH